MKGVMVALLLAFGAPALAADACLWPADVAFPSGQLPNLERALQRREPIKIVAFGTGSTLGIGASGPQATYPARLERALAERLPQPVTVVNKSIARQPAREMLARLGKDVLSERPVLVIWETGTVDAVRGIDPMEFSEVLTSGIQKLRKAGADVILIDPQFSRRMSGLVNIMPFLDAMRAIASSEELPLFDRFEIMRDWAERDQFQVSERPGPEVTGQIDRIYDCLGRLLAESIRRVGVHASR